MILVVQGSRNFEDYNIFLFAMRSVLSTIKESGDNELIICSAGPRRINEMSLEFTNISQNSLKGMGVKLRTRKVTLDWVKDNIYNIDLLAYFSQPKEPKSPLVKFAEDKDVEVAIYRY